MKICHITSVHNSGDVRILEKECTSLAKKIENDVYLVASGDSYEKNGVKVLGIGEKPKSRIKRFRTHAKNAVIRAISVEADVYHLHDPELLQYVNLLKKTGKKVIYDSHEDTISDIGRKEYIPTFLRKIIAYGVNSYFKRVIPKLDGVITVTPSLVRQFETLNKNVAMVTNYPIYVDWSKNKDIPARRTDGKKVLFFAGGISKMWSHENVIKAIEEIDKVVYKLYGPSDSEYLSRLKCMNGWNKVEFGGKVPFYDVNLEMENAYMGVALMDYIRGEDKEGTLGNTKFFEVMSHGIPVLCTDFSLWENIIKEENCGIYVNPRDTKQIKEAIEFLINNPNVAKEMGIRGKRAAEKHYNWASQELVLYNFYDQLKRS